MSINGVSNLNTFDSVNFESTEVSSGVTQYNKHEEVVASALLSLEQTTSSNSPPLSTRNIQTLLSDSTANSDLSSLVDKSNKIKLTEEEKVERKKINQKKYRDTHREEINEKRRDKYYDQRIKQKEDTDNHPTNIQEEINTEELNSPQTNTDMQQGNHETVDPKLRAKERKRITDAAFREKNREKIREKRRERYKVSKIALQNGTATPSQLEKQNKEIQYRAINRENKNAKVNARRHARNEAIKNGTATPDEIEQLNKEKATKKRHYDAHKNEISEQMKALRKLQKLEKH